MGKEPLKLQTRLEDIQIQMNERGLNTLHSISKWEKRNWQEWNTIRIPPNLKGQWDNLRKHLKGTTPTSIQEEDTFAWDPSEGCYTVKTGYKALQDQQNHQDWAHWKSVWKIESLPKIKMFIQTLLKGKILTSENLKKKVFMVHPGVLCS